MCGIFAALCSNSKEDLLPYFDIIQHRGPDASKIEIIDDNLIFGFHRLAIIDPTDKSMQPLTLNDLVLICNGEIFNYKELSHKYGLTMNTGSDCEIILHLYEYFGRNEKALKRLLNELRAEFAFVLYDKRAKTLMAGRDPFGIRPLFYSYSGNEILFASEMKALLFRENVKPMIPGSFIFRETHDNGHNTTKFIKYYNIDLANRVNSISKLNGEDSLEFIHANIRDLLEQSVKLRLMSDRPIGCFLSGGLDSSLITALVAKHVSNLHCFSIGLENGVDILASRKVVDFLNNKGCNITHHIVTFTIEEGFNAIRDVIKCLETRCVTTIRAGVVNYLLAKYISENTDIKVLYSGSGADEVFNGYQYGKLITSSRVLEEDSARLLNELYLYDNLRDDRTTANFGLEVRVPFLCRDLVDYIFSIPGRYRLSFDDMEKMLLRDSFKNEELLPDDILYRRKEAWSDAVSSSEISWYKTLSDKYIEPFISDEEILSAERAFPYDTPRTKESLYYRRIFSEFFPGRDNVIPKLWLPPKKIIGKTIFDPSATVLSCYKN